MSKINPHVRDNLSEVFKKSPEAKDNLLGLRKDFPYKNDLVYDLSDIIPVIINGIYLLKKKGDRLPK